MGRALNTNTGVVLTANLGDSQSPGQALSLVLTAGVGVELTEARSITLISGDGDREVDLSNGNTGTGALVFATSPTLVTPVLGTPSSGNLASCTAYEGTAVASTGEAGAVKFLREDGDGTCSWQALAGGGDALVANPLSQFAATTSAQLAGVISDETGTGLLVFATSPTLTTPILGTPTSGTLTNCTGPTSMITSGTFADARISESSVTQHQAALSITESQISDLVHTVATLNAIGNVTITSIASGEILKWNGSAWINNTLAEAGIAATSHNHAASEITSGTMTDARIAESNVTQHEAAIDHDALTNFVAAEHVDWTGDAGASNIHVNNITAVPAAAVTAHEAALTITESQISDLGTLAAMVADNLSVFAATTSAQLAGVISDETGSGSLVFATSPTLTTPVLGTPASGTLTNCTGPTSMITSGTFADARISESSVTQHQTALSITESQISDLTHAVATLGAIGNVTITAIASGEVLKWNGSAWINNTLAEAGIAAASHNHTESEISDLGTTVAMVADNLSVFAATTSAQLAGIISDETGSGALVFATSPTLITPVLGTPSSGALGSCTAYEAASLASTGEAGGSKFLREDGDGTCSFQAITGGGDALVANPLSQFAATTSAQLAGVISDETGTGLLVFATSPTLTTPVLGTPTSGTLTNCTAPTSMITSGTFADARVSESSVTQHQAALAITESQVSDLGTTVAMVADNLSVFAATTSAQIRGVISDETGTGALVFATSPTLVTPVLGTPASGTLTNCTGPAGMITSGTLPVARGGTGSGVALNQHRVMVSDASGIIESGALTNGQVLIGSTGFGPVGAAITGTSNEVVVSNGAGTINLSLPQQIHTSATPTFTGMQLTTTGAPFTIPNTTTVCTNLNADLLDGSHASAFGVVANPLSQFAATTSAQLAGVLSDETGTGAAVFGTDPTFVRPVLGTPASGGLLNCTGPAGMITSGTFADARISESSVTQHRDAMMSGIGWLDFGTPTELTISAGVVTATQSFHQVDTESDAATDDLDTIHGGSSGRVLYLNAINGSRDVTLKHGTGNIRMGDGADATLAAFPDRAYLIFQGSNWYLISAVV